MLTWGGREEVTFEQTARERKVEKLAKFLREQWGWNAGDLAARMNDAQWAQVAQCAAVRKPSRITRVQVLARLGVPRRKCEHRTYPTLWGVQ